MIMYSNKIYPKFRHPPSYHPQPRTLNIKPEERQSQIIAVPGISNVLKYVGGKSKNYWPVPILIFGCWVWSWDWD